MTLSEIEQEIIQEFREEADFNSLSELEKESFTRFIRQSLRKLVEGIKKEVESRVESNRKHPLFLVEEGVSTDISAGYEMENNYLEVGSHIHCLYCHLDIPKEEFIAHIDAHDRNKDTSHLCAGPECVRVFSQGGSSMKFSTGPQLE